MDVATDHVSLCWGSSGFSVLMLMLLLEKMEELEWFRYVIYNRLVMEYIVNFEHFPHWCITSNTGETGSYGFIMFCHLQCVKYHLPHNVICMENCLFLRPHLFLQFCP